MVAIKLPKLLHQHIPFLP
uniref:Uncharacterized protein n=1 Tax=Anguilla anguilla TaxID=7936 RepID=A0A0E9T7I9_ANGAN